MPFTSLTTLRVAAAKLPPYLSPSWVTPNVSLNDGLDLAPRIFPLLLIIDTAQILVSIDKTFSKIAFASV